MTSGAEITGVASLSALALLGAFAVVAVWCGLGIGHFPCGSLQTIRWATVAISVVAILAAGFARRDRGDLYLSTVFVLCVDAVLLTILYV